MKKLRRPVTFATALLGLVLVPISSGCSYETVEDIADETNEMTNGVDDGRYSTDPIDRISNPPR